MTKTLLVFLLACGGSPKQPQRPPDDQGWQAKPLPRDNGPAECKERVDFAMDCFDAGKRGEKCASVVAAKKAPACDPSPDTCANACASGANPNESHEHYYMLMTAPPP